jgi:hypothetical protein
MSISDFKESSSNELEVARKRFGEAEVAVETARREWKAAKRRRREAKEAARRAKKRLRRAKKELELAQCAATEAEKIDARRGARVAKKTKFKPHAIKRAKKETKKLSEVPTAPATESVPDFSAQTAIDPEPAVVETVVEPSSHSLGA